MQPKKDYRRVPNFNLASPEIAGAAISFRRLLSLRFLLTLVIIVEVLFLLSLYLGKFTLDSAMVSIQKQIQQAEAQLATATSPQKKEAEELLVTIETLKKVGEALENDWQELTVKQVDWAQVMSAFFSQPPGVELRSITQKEATQVNAMGTASDYMALVEYRRTLLNSPSISRIISLRSEKSGGVISFSLEVEVKVREK